MAGYSTREVAEILGLTEPSIRGFVRSGLIEPDRTSSGAFRFDFTHVVLLRTVRELKEAGVSTRRIKRSLAELRRKLPDGIAISSLAIGSDGEEIVVREDDAVWEPMSGQLHMDFSTRELADDIRPLAERRARTAAESADVLGADAWCEIARDLEPVSADRAMDAYLRSLRADPGHVDSHLNLGRMLHEDGRLGEAEGHYRQALAAAPDSSTAAFNLGVVSEDLGRSGEAKRAYRRALEHEPGLSAAHFNLARLLEREGREREALQHLAEYRRIEKLEGRRPGS